MRTLILGAARVWDHVVSSGGVCGSEVMWRGGQALCVVFLLSVTLQTAARRPCSKDIIASVQHLFSKASHQMDLDPRLYTPTITDYRKCPKSTMMCFAMEVTTLLQEMGDIHNRMNKRLETIARMLNQPQLDCPECELHTENTMEEFLVDLLQVLQAINVDNCPPNPQRVAEEVVRHRFRRQLPRPSQV